MSQKLQKERGIAASKGVNPMALGIEGVRGGPANGTADMAAAGEDDRPTPSDATADVRSDAHSVQYILAMVHDLKKLAAKSGLLRVALILEMAELEARDQMRKPAR